MSIMLIMSNAVTCLRTSLLSTVRAPAHVGGNAQAREATIADVIAYLTTVLGSGNDAPGD